MSTWADQIEAARGQHSDVATFDAACSWVQEVAAPQRLLPDACLLRLYAAFKQATVGPAPPRSGQLDPKKRAKWQAWDAVRSLDIAQRQRRASLRSSAISSSDQVSMADGVPRMRVGSSSPAPTSGVPFVASLPTTDAAMLPRRKERLTGMSLSRLARGRN